MYALTYSKDSISFIISWRTCYPHWQSLVGVFTPREYDRADFGCIWIQSNSIVAHVEIKGCCKSEAFKLLQYSAYFLGLERVF